MLALLAVVVLIPLLYLPGYLIAQAALGLAQSPDMLKRHYERVVAGALLNGWLALTLAELGIFSAWLHLLLLLVICAGCAAVAWRRGGLRLPQAPLGIVAGNGARVRAPARMWAAANWEALSFAAVGLVFALLVARPFEVVLGARDAGVYANTGFAIAISGGIVQHDALVQQIGRDQQSDDPGLKDAADQAETNFLGNQAASRFIATRLRLSGFQIWSGDLDEGRVVPQFLHLYPAWIGLLASLLGLRGGLLASGLLGFLGVWSVGMLGRRLAGPWVGLLGALLLALNGVQVWFSRYSTSEACAQFLCFATLYGFAVMQEGRPFDPSTHSTSSGQASSGQAGSGQASSGQAGSGGTAAVPVSVFGQDKRTTDGGLNPHSRSSFAGLLAGVAAGQLALTRIDFFVIVAPLLLYLAYMALTKRWSVALWALASGLGVMLLQAVLHIIFISRAYFLDTLYARLQDQSAIVANLVYYLWTPALQKQFMEIPRSAPLRAPLRLPIELALVAALVAAFVLLRHDGRPQRWFERLVLRYRRGLLRAGAAIIILLGVYGYIIRPQILTPQVIAAAPSCITPAQLSAPSEACLALQGYIGAPIAPPKHPNQVAYIFDALPKWIQGKSVSPLDATSFSPGNPSESQKIGIAQANLVRLGWYLSPLGILLGVAGFALWWRQRLNRASWLFLIASLISAVFFLRLAYGATDLTYIYILRRYMPMVYPAFSLGMAYALVALAQRAEKDEGRKTKDERRLRTFVFRLSSFVCSLVLIGFFVVTNRPLYSHVEYEGALAQISAIVERYSFGPRDVLLFRGEGRDTPDLMVTPLKYAFGIDALAIRSPDPRKYAEELARYVQRWQSQGRTVYLVLGANGAVDLPGLQATRLGPASLRLSEFQQLQDQKPRRVQEFALDFAVYQLAPGAANPSAQPPTIAVDDYAAQVRGFWHPEQIDGATVVWTDGDAQLRLPWPRDNAPQTLTIELSPGATRPTKLGPAHVCVSYRPEASFKLPDLPYLNEQCVTLSSARMTSYRFTIDPRGQTPPATGAYVLRIFSKPWVPAQVDPAQIDQRGLGVQFGGIRP
jgi:hypothetical protein